MDLYLIECGNFDILRTPVISKPKLTKVVKKEAIVKPYIYIP